MENDSRSVFDRLDSQDRKLDSVDEKIDELIKAFNESKNQERKTSDSNAKTQKAVDNKTRMFLFMRGAKKEYLWFGPDHDFSKSKRLLCLNMVLLIFAALFSTVFTSVAIGFYSTFTLFENIWLAFCIAMTVYSFNFKKRMLDTDLKSHSCENFKQDRDGTWRIYSYKKSFLWFRRLSDIACVANIIMMWCLNKGPMSIVATILEILLLGLTICTIFSYSNLFSMYGNFILYTNKNEANKTITLVWDNMGRKLMTYDDFNKKFGKTLL